MIFIFIFITQLLTKATVQSHFVLNFSITKKKKSDQTNVDSRDSVFNVNQKYVNQQSTTTTTLFIYIYIFIHMFVFLPLPRIEVREKKIIFFHYLFCEIL